MNIQRLEVKTTVFIVMYITQSMNIIFLMHHCNADFRRKYIKQRYHTRQFFMFNFIGLLNSENKNVLVKLRSFIKSALSHRMSLAMTVSQKIILYVACLCANDVYEFGHCNIFKYLL